MMERKLVQLEHDEIQSRDSRFVEPLLFLLQLVYLCEGGLPAEAAAAAAAVVMLIIGSWEACVIRKRRHSKLSTVAKQQTLAKGSPQKHHRPPEFALASCRQADVVAKSSQR